MLEVIAMFSSFQALTFAGAGVALLGIGFLLGGNAKERAADAAVQAERARAIEGGVGRFIADEKTGIVSFQYGK